MIPNTVSSKTPSKKEYPRDIAHGDAKPVLITRSIRDIRN